MHESPAEVAEPTETTAPTEPTEPTEPMEVGRAASPFGGLAWFAWLLAVCGTCSTAAAMPNVAHDMAAAIDRAPSFFGVWLALGLVGTSALLRFIALPRSIERGAVRAGSFRALVQLGFCWLLVWLSLGGVVTVWADGGFDSVPALVGLALLLVTVEVPPRQPSRK